MKELSIEEKAKRYDKVIDIAEKELDACGSQDCDAARQIFRLFPELKESEDEKIRKNLISYINISKHPMFSERERNEMLAWLEKQGEKHIDRELSYLLNRVICGFINDPNIPYSERDEVSKKIIPYVEQLEKQGKSYTKRDVDDAYLEGVTNTKNEIEKQYEANYQIRKDIATFIFNYKGNIKDKAKWMNYLGIKVSFAEMQGEKKPADKVEPKFKIGDWITDGYLHCKIADVLEDRYIVDTKFVKRSAILSDNESRYHLWTIQDAKPGDVLVNGSNIFIFHFISDTRLMGYCHVNINDGRFYKDLGKNECFCLIDAVVHPATKEQRVQLEKAMTDAGYTFDFEKKELKKIEDKHTWSEEDEIYIENIRLAVEKQYPIAAKDIVDWLKSLKGRVQTKQEWGEDDEKTLDSILGDIGIADKTIGGSPTYQKKRDWLKSLRPKKQNK